MKANEVLEMLNVSRHTLGRYVKQNKIIAIYDAEKGRYDYDEDSVKRFINKKKHYKTCIYCRIDPTTKQEVLSEQLNKLYKYCKDNNIEVDGIFTDIDYNSAFARRAPFIEMLDLILVGNIKRVIIDNRSVIADIGYDLFQYLCIRAKCEIVVLSEENLGN